jgi:signal transduction histidine kinase
VSVSDTGSGISSDVRERIFEPFFTTKEVGKGSGLGLSQVIGVVKQLGGGLIVRSTLGAGTSISILLPRADASARCETAVATRCETAGGGR